MHRRGFNFWPFWLKLYQFYRVIVFLGKTKMNIKHEICVYCLAYKPKLEAFRSTTYSSVHTEFDFSAYSSRSTNNKKKIYRFEQKNYYYYRVDKSQMRESKATTRMNKKDSINIPSSFFGSFNVIFLSFSPQIILNSTFYFSLYLFLLLFCFHNGAAVGVSVR